MRSRVRGAAARCRPDRARNSSKSMRPERTSTAVSSTTERPCEERSLRSKFALAFALLLAALAFALPQRASAIPLFAQRYRLQCGACHTVLPELNAFGQHFR